MRFLQRFTRGELRLARIEALSDGVFAIILTLLVLELKVPVLQHHESASELGHGLLMSQAFIPFPAALMGEYAANPLAVSAFGAVMAAATLVFIALHSYILRHLLRPELAAEQDPHIIRKSFIGVVSYLIGAGVAWLHVYLGFLAYFITPLFFIVPPPPRRLAAAPSTAR